MTLEHMMEASKYNLLDSKMRATIMNIFFFQISRCVEIHNKVKSYMSTLADEEHESGVVIIVIKKNIFWILIMEVIDNL